MQRGREELAVTRLTVMLHLHESHIALWQVATVVAAEFLFGDIILKLANVRTWTIGSC